MRRTPLELAALASAAVPGLSPAGVRHLADVDEDFDSALIVDMDGSRWRVRAPRRDEAGAQLDTEINALRIFTPNVRAALPFVVPNIAGRVAGTGKGQAAVYSFLPGEPMELPTSGLPGNQAIALGNALAHIHNLDTDVVERANLPFYSAEECRQRRRVELDQAAATRKVPERLVTRWGRALDDKKLWNFTSTVVHGQLSEDNILVSRDRIVAVQNWSELHVGDPAEDLAWIVATNNTELCEDVFAAYTTRRYDKPDAQLLIRAELTAEFALAQWLLHGFAMEDSRIIHEATELLGDLDQHILHNAHIAAEAAQSLPTPDDQVVLTISGDDGEPGEPEASVPSFMSPAPKAKAAAASLPVPVRPAPESDKTVAIALPKEDSPSGGSRERGGPSKDTGTAPVPEQSSAGLDPVARRALENRKSRASSQQARQAIWQAAGEGFGIRAPESSHDHESSHDQDQNQEQRSPEPHGATAPVEAGTSPADGGSPDSPSPSSPGPLKVRGQHQPTLKLLQGVVSPVRTGTGGGRATDRANGAGGVNPVDAIVTETVDEQRRRAGKALQGGPLPDAADVPSPQETRPSSEAAESVPDRGTEGRRSFGSEKIVPAAASEAPRVGGPSVTPSTAEPAKDPDPRGKAQHSALSGLLSKLTNKLHLGDSPGPSPSPAEDSSGGAREVPPSDKDVQAGTPEIPTSRIPVAAPQGTTPEEKSASGSSGIPGLDGLVIPPPPAAPPTLGLAGSRSGAEENPAPVRAAGRPPSSASTESPAASMSNPPHPSNPDDDGSRPAGDARGASAKKPAKTVNSRRNMAPEVRRREGDSALMKAPVSALISPETADALHATASQPPRPAQPEPRKAPDPRKAQASRKQEPSTQSLPEGAGRGKTPSREGKTTEGSSSPLVDPQGHGLDTGTAPAGTPAGATERRPSPQERQEQVRKHGLDHLQRAREAATGALPRVPLKVAEEAETGRARPSASGAAPSAVPSPAEVARKARERSGPRLVPLQDLVAPAPAKGSTGPGDRLAPQPSADRPAQRDRPATDATEG